MITMNFFSGKEPQPPVYFHTACMELNQSNMHYGIGQQQFHQILLVVSGTGLVRCQGKELPLKRGCAFYTAEYCVSEYINTGGLKTAFVTAKGSLLQSLVAYYGCGEFLYTDKIHTESSLQGIQDIITEFYAQKRQGRLSAMVYQYFVDFFEQMRPSVQTSAERACLYIERSFTQKLTLESVARQCGISVSKLCHDFKAVYGSSVFSYILHLRLTYARSLLHASTSLPIKQVALACGFEDASYFCKAFKEKYGCTPATDQKQSI